MLLVIAQFHAFKAWFSFFFSRSEAALVRQGKLNESKIGRFADLRKFYLSSFAEPSGLLSIIHLLPPTNPRHLIC